MWGPSSKRQKMNGGNVGAELVWGHFGGHVGSFLGGPSFRPEFLLFLLIFIFPFNLGLVAEALNGLNVQSCNSFMYAYSLI